MMRYVSSRFLGMQPGVLSSVAEANRMYHFASSASSSLDTMDNLAVIFPPRRISDEGPSHEPPIEGLPPQLCAVPKRKASLGILTSYILWKAASRHGIKPHACLYDLNALSMQQLSLHRRGNRRVWYQLKRKPEVALCSFCGMVAARGTLFIGSPNCSGQCLGQPSKQYPDEYKQPI